MKLKLYHPLSLRPSPDDPNTVTLPNGRKIRLPSTIAKIAPGSTILTTQAVTPDDASSPPLPPAPLADPTLTLLTTPAPSSNPVRDYRLPPERRAPLDAGRRAESKLSQALRYYDRADPPITPYEAARRFGLWPANVYDALRRRAARGAIQCPTCGYAPGGKGHRFVPSPPAPPRRRS